MASSSTRAHKVTSGVDRSFESIDVRHPHYPVALYLLARERFFNLVRHGADFASIQFKETPTGDFRVIMRDTGDGNADISRLLEPADESGSTTSQYAFGERITRLKCSSRRSPSFYAWKKKDDLYYNILQQNAEGYRPRTVNIDDPTAIWKVKEDHGFYTEIDFLQDRLEGRKKHEIMPILKSVLCMSLSPEILARIHIQIEVRDVNGDVICEEIKPGKPTKTGKPRKVRDPAPMGLADSVTDKWVSLLTILRRDTIGGVDVVEGRLSSKANVVAEFVRLDPEANKKDCNVIREYASKKGNAALIVMHGFVTPVSLPEALGKAPHPSSQNGRFVILTVNPPEVAEDGKSPLEIEHIRQQSMPTQASSKVTFLGSCKLYQELLGFLRTEKPEQWDKFIKKDSDSESADSHPDPPPAPPSNPRMMLSSKLHKLARSLRKLEDLTDTERSLCEAIERYQIN